VLASLVPAGQASGAQLLAQAAALQAGSEHALARAVLAAARAGTVPAAGVQSATDAAGTAQGGPHTAAGVAAASVIAPAVRVNALPGRGLEGEVDGALLLLGSSRLMRERGMDTSALEATASALEHSGHTVSWLADASACRLLGLLAFTDPPKPTARAAVERLQQRGLQTVMLTGDNQGSADAVAAATGIGRAYANLLPADKTAHIAAMKEQGAMVAMVGDGINDAPALAAAHVGIAMSSGTDVAMHAAGITLMRGDPALVADAIDISKRTMNKIRQNLFWAFIYNLAGIPLAAFGMLSPVLAGAAMALSSVSVISNALLLRRWQPAGKDRA